MTAAPDGLVIEGILTGNGFVQTNGSSFADWLARHDADVARLAIGAAFDWEDEQEGGWSMPEARAGAQELWHARATSSDMSTGGDS